MWIDSLMVLAHSRSSSPSLSSSSPSPPSSSFSSTSSAVLTWLAIMIWTSSLPSAAKKCQSHSECIFNQFCTFESHCALCLNCDDNDAVAAAAADDDKSIVGHLRTFDGGACPEKCRCSSHDQCAIFAGHRPYKSYYRTGFFCATYDDGATDEESESGAVNGTETRSVCQSCEELYDLGIYAPPFDVATSDTGSDRGSIYFPTSSLCPDIPCVCSTSSDCPVNHYCASDLQQYVPDSSFIGPNGPWLDSERMGPCRGYCVNCSLGCVDDLIVSYDQANQTDVGNKVGNDDNHPQTCHDVCSSTYVQCNTHEECQNPYADYTDDYLYEDEASSRWCSANHQCNECSWGCAWDTSNSTAIHFWDSRQLFPSIDGVCPYRCCGWGVSREPYWSYDKYGVVSPCGVTSETEFFAAYLVSDPQVTINVTIDEFLTNGQPCIVEEVQYWEQSSPRFTDDALGEQDVRRPTKIARVDCSAMTDLPCTQYPVMVAVWMKQSSSVEAYEYIIGPKNVSPDMGYNCYGNLSASWEDDDFGFALVMIIMLVTCSCVGCVCCSICSDEEHRRVPNTVTTPILDNNNSSNNNNNTNTNALSSSALPTAIPVSLFGPTDPPPPNPSELEVTEIILKQSRPVMVSPLSPDCDSDDEV